MITRYRQIGIAFSRTHPFLPPQPKREPVIAGYRQVGMAFSRTHPFFPPQPKREPVIAGYRQVGMAFSRTHPFFPPQPKREPVIAGYRTGSCMAFSRTHPFFPPQPKRKPVIAGYRQVCICFARLSSAGTADGPSVQGRIYSVSCKAYANLHLTFLIPESCAYRARYTHS